MRLFAAVRPPAHVLDHLEQALEAVRGPDEHSGGMGPLRWAPPDDRHITLAFFGEVPAGAELELRAGLAALTADGAPLRAQLRGAGVFDRRIFWIGVGGQVDRLGDLITGCTDLGTQVTGRADSRVRSRAHLTVARVRSQARTRSGASRHHRAAGRAGSAGSARSAGPGGPGGDRVAVLAHALAVYVGPEWTVDEVALVSSRPGEGRGGGPLYRTEQTFRLGGPSGWASPTQQAVDDPADHTEPGADTRP